MKRTITPQRTGEIIISKSPLAKKISKREIPESLMSLFDKFSYELKKTETTTTIDNSVKFTADNKSIIIGGDSTITKDSFNSSIKAGRDVIITNNEYHNEGFKEAYYSEKEKNKLYKKQIENLKQEIEVLKTKLSKGE